MHQNDAARSMPVWFWDLSLGCSWRTNKCIRSNKHVVFPLWLELAVVYISDKGVIWGKLHITQCPNLFKNGQEIHVFCMLHIKLIQHFLDNLTCLQSYLVPFLIHLENWRFFQITNFSCQNSKKWAIIKTFLLIIRFWRNLVRL